LRPQQAFHSAISGRSRAQLASRSARGRVHRAQQLFPSTPGGHLQLATTPSERSGRLLQIPSALPEHSGRLLQIPSALPEHSGRLCQLATHAIERSGRLLQLVTPTIEHSGRPVADSQRSPRALGTPLADSQRSPRVLGTPLPARDARDRALAWPVAGSARPLGASGAPVSQRGATGARASRSVTVRARSYRPLDARPGHGVRSVVFPVRAAPGCVCRGAAAGRTPGGCAGFDSRGLPLQSGRVPAGHVCEQAVVLTATRSPGRSTPRDTRRRCVLRAVFRISIEP
jgi:hypothetical protein